MSKQKLPVYFGLGHDFQIGEVMIEDLDDLTLQKLTNLICPACDGPLIPNRDGKTLYCPSCQEWHGLVEEWSVERGK